MTHTQFNERLKSSNVTLIYLIKKLYVAVDLC